MVVVRAASERRRRRAKQFNARRGEPIDRLGKQLAGCGFAAAFRAHDGQRSVRRHPRLRAQVQLVGGKAVVAGTQQRDEIGVLRIERLDPHFARALGASGAPGNLHDELRGAFRRPEVRGEKPGVRVQHRDQRHVRKVVAFGKHLRADQNGRSAGVDGGQVRLHLPNAAHGVAVDPMQRHAGMPFGERLFGALGAGADRYQFLAAAVGAALRRRSTEAAVMAAQLSGRAVVDESRIAVRALGSPSAVAAQQHRREAPSIDEDQHLAVGREVLLDGVVQRGAEAAIEARAADVQHAIDGHGSAAGPLGQPRVAIASPAHVGQRFQRRRGAAQNYRNGQHLPALDGHVPGRVTQTVVLLEGAVVLLVDDDDAQVGERRQHRRTGADHHLVRAVGAVQPGVEALRVRNPRVQGGGSAETLLETRHGLRRQGDLRHQQQRLAAGLERLGDDAHVHLGLAAAGDAVEQVRGGRCQGGANGGDRRILGGGGLRALGGKARRQRLHGASRDKPLLLQRQERAPLDAQRRHFGVGHLAELQQTPQHLSLSRCAIEFRGNSACSRRPGPFLLGDGLAALARPSGQQRRVDLADGMVVVGREPVGQVDEIRRQQRLGIQHLLDGLQGVGRRLAPAGNHANDLRAAEGHPHTGADGRRRSGRWRRVVEGAVQRPRHCDLNDGGLAGHATAATGLARRTPPSGCASTPTAPSRRCLPPPGGTSPFGRRPRGASARRRRRRWSWLRTWRRGIRGWQDPRR